MTGQKARPFLTLPYRTTRRRPALIPARKTRMNIGSAEETVALGRPNSGMTTGWVVGLSSGRLMGGPARALFRSHSCSKF